MKKYKVNLLTERGPVSIIIVEGDDLKAVEQALALKYSKFITLNTVKI